MMGILLVLLWHHKSSSKETYELGGAEHPWRDMGKADLLAIEETGTIHPLYFTPDENMTVTTYDRGGRIFIVNPIFGYGGYGRAGEEKWSKMIDGDPETAFVQGGHSAEALDMFYFDLGGSLPVNRIRFHPRESRPGQVLPTLELSINDGDPKHQDDLGAPVHQHIVLYRPVAIHGDIIRDIHFPLQPVRYVILKPVSPEYGSHWEVAEMEVYGEGYVPQSSYLSDFIGLEDLASWGELRWIGERSEHAKVSIHTRTGLDDDPNVYWRKTGRADELTSRRPTGELLTRNDYDQLPTKVKGPVTYDTDNWSFWSAPYDFDAGLIGVGITSPGPRRYIQLRIDFVSTWTDAGHLERVMFDYSMPPVATDAVAEIWPDEVEMGRRTRFVYALKPRLRSTDLGFNGVEVVTHTPADTVRSVRFGGDEIPFSAVYLEDPSRFVVAFMEYRIDASRTGRVLEIEFDASVFRYSTEFSARVLDTEADEVSQLVNPGNATVRIPSDGISVRTALGEGTIGSASATPRAITPNGDGINDEVEISYDLFKLTSGAEVTLAVHKLSGAQIRLLYAGSEASGRYRHTWDGRDDDGHTVPPGIYLYALEVHTDEGVERRAGTVCIAY